MAVECEFYRKCEVAKVFGVSESTVERWVKQEKLPQPIQLGPNRVAWDKQEIQQAIERMKKQSRGFRSPYGQKRS